MKMILSAVALMALPTMASAQTMSAATYVMKAGASDLFERESAKIEMVTTNADLKSFANQMIADHTTSTNDVKAAAMQAGMKVAPPHLDAMQTRDLAKLRAAKGAARDKLYVMQQKAAHQQALMVQQNYADNGTVAPLKAAAAKIVPVVQSHIAMLQSM